MLRLRKAFTLIELLVVIAIIAILSVVVILTLNPAELLRQSRDANRVSDMATISNALNIYLTDQGSASSFSLGSSSATYLSVYDPSATSTAGDQCQGLSMPALNASSGQYWQCSTNNTQRLANGTGWIPVNLQNISSGAPIGNFPVDPTNQTSTDLFYSYNTNGSQFEVAANLESQKYKSQYGISPQTPNLPEVITGGTPAVSSLYNPTGLAGYWNFDEGSGSSTMDTSGNGNMGTWSGTANGNNSSYYLGGKVGLWAGTFDGTSTKVTIPNAPSLDISGSGSAVTLMAWVNLTTSGSGGIVVRKGYEGANQSEWELNLYPTAVGFRVVAGTGRGQVTTSTLPAVGTWFHIAATCVYGATTSIIYVNGISQPLVIADGTASSYKFPSTSNTVVIGSDSNSSGGYYKGLIDDVRIYNRALSAAEIQAIYNAEK